MFEGANKKTEIIFPKYRSSFTNEKGDTFVVFSMENYKDTDKDLKSFIAVLNDEPVRKYITNDAMSKYGYTNLEFLAKDILSNSASRWSENAERRFLVRDFQSNAVGMIGVTLKNRAEGELWYYKTSSVPSFMFEALVVVLDFLKQEGVKDLFAIYESGNTRSTQILSKLGFKESKSGEMRIILTNLSSNIVH